MAPRNVQDSSLYRTACCGPSGVLIAEVSLYRTACCGPNGVLITEVSLRVSGYQGILFYLGNR